MKSYVQDSDGLVHEASGAGHGAVATPCGRIFVGPAIVFAVSPATCLRCLLDPRVELDEAPARR